MVLVKTQAAEWLELLNMAKRNDFLEGFLKGLYNSGVGNPEVQRANEAAMQERNASLTTTMAGEGMTPNVLPSDHPISQKIGGFISSLFGGASTAPLLASSFKQDPTKPQYYQTPEGTTSFTMGGKPIPIGAAKLPVDKGPALVAATGKMERTNIPFDTAKSMATLANKPTAFDAIISSAQKSGRDYITKDEMANAMRAISTGAQSEKGDFFKGMLDVHRQRLELAQRQAAFGSSGYGKNQVSLNTAMEHTNSVKNGLDAINNTDINLLNVPINELKANTNDPNIISLEADITALSDELASAFKGSSGTDIQMQEWAKFLKSSITPSQAQALMPTIADLLDARLTNLERQQKLVAPSVVQEGNIMSPTARKARTAINSVRPVTSGKPQTVIQNGHTYTLNPLTGKYE